MKPDQLSKPAAFIAIKFYGLTRDEPFFSLFDDDVIQFYESIVSCLPAPFRYCYQGLKHTSMRSFFSFGEALLLPGDLMHIILRKWYLERWVKKLRQSDYTQMLVLGGGFDHLATLNASNDFYCVELDAPYMSMTKRNFVEKQGYSNTHLKIIDTFFTRDHLPQILSAKTKLDATKKTIVVSEGFFDYFTSNSCSLILNELNDFFEDNITLLSTLFSLDELSSFHSFVYRKSIKLTGEKLKLNLNRKKYISLLKRRGFAIKKVVDSTKMKKDVLKPHNISNPILKGFYMIEAERK